MPADDKKGITVKVDAVLHAEVKQYLEDHGMTMADFVTLALTDELHPKIQRKEEKDMGNMRTLAFQVPEELFLRIKDYLQRNNMTQKDFVIGLIEHELDREQAVREGVSEGQAASGGMEEGTTGSGMEAGPGEMERQYSEETGPVESEDEQESEDEDEEEGMGFTMGM